MEQHPLQYFKNLITKGYIINERTDFFLGSTYGQITKKDFQNDTIEYCKTDAFNEDAPVESIQVTFDGHLQAKLTNATTDVIDLVDTQMLIIYEEKKQVLYLKTLYKSINSLILYAKEIERFKKYPFIAELLESLKFELIDKYGVADDTAPQKNIHVSSQPHSSNKLQWMGKSKVLITLFYDLYSNVENGGEPLIKATKEQVKNFLLNNFIEKDGQPLSASSIDTVLTPSKEAKRALKGDRIDTSKLRDKN